jgi:Ca-activated chloride channel family protein
VLHTPILNKRDPGQGHFIFALFFLILGILGFSPTSTTEPSPAIGNAQAKIAVDANLVLLPVKVTDTHGAFVSGLKLEDFRVSEDGQLQKLAVFEYGDTPVTVGLIVDHSRSMGGKLQDVVTAVYSFAHLSNPQDEMFVIDFNDDVLSELMKGKAFSNDPKELEQAVTAVTARGRTALYDAVSEGLHHLQYGHLQKKALIIISDGGDNASHLKYSQVLAQARQSQALIYAVGLIGSNVEEENPGLLRRLCKDTGGIAYFAREGQSVANVATEIAHDLREQYTVGYTPLNIQRAGAFRRVEVKVIAPGHVRLHVRTREGYSPAAVMQPAAQLGVGTR